MIVKGFFSSMANESAGVDEYTIIETKENPLDIPQLFANEDCLFGHSTYSNDRDTFATPLRDINVKEKETITYDANLYPDDDAEDTLYVSLTNIPPNQDYEMKFIGENQDVEEAEVVCLSGEGFGCFDEFGDIPLREMKSLWYVEDIRQQTKPFFINQHRSCYSKTALLPITMQQTPNDNVITTKRRLSVSKTITMPFIDTPDAKPSLRNVTCEPKIINTDEPPTSVVVSEVSMSEIPNKEWSKCEISQVKGELVELEMVTFEPKPHHDPIVGMGKITIIEPNLLPAHIGSCISCKESALEVKKSTRYISILSQRNVVTKCVSVVFVDPGISSDRFISNPGISMDHAVEQEEIVEEFHYCVIEETVVYEDETYS